MRRGPAVVLALAVALAAADPSRARACSNAVREIDWAVLSVQAAERALNDGDPYGARDQIPKMLSALDKQEQEHEDVSGLRDRASRIRALVDVRLDPVGHARGERRETLAGAATTLARLADEHPNDAARLTDLGEALARTRPLAAKEILEDLAARDLMTTPYGYVTLARLRAADRDAKGRDEALARCLPMAKVASICRLDPTPSALAGVLPVVGVAAALAALALAVRRVRSRRAPGDEDEVRSAGPSGLTGRMPRCLLGAEVELDMSLTESGTGHPRPRTRGGS
jgi:hypothetical protein